MENRYSHHKSLEHCISKLATKIPSNKPGMADNSKIDGNYTKY